MGRVPKRLRLFTLNVLIILSNISAHRKRPHFLQTLQVIRELKGTSRYYVNQRPISRQVKYHNLLLYQGPLRLTDFPRPVDDEIDYPRAPMNQSHGSQLGEEKKNTCNSFQSIAPHPTIFTEPLQCNLSAIFHIFLLVYTDYISQRRFF